MLKQPETTSSKNARIVKLRACSHEVGDLGQVGSALGSNPENSHDFWIIPGPGILLTLADFFGGVQLVKASWLRNFLWQSHSPVSTSLKSWSSSVGHKDIHSLGICTNRNCHILLNLVQQLLIVGFSTLFALIYFVYWPRSPSFRMGSFSFRKVKPKHSRHSRSMIPSKPSSPNR